MSRIRVMPEAGNRAWKGREPLQVDRGGRRAGLDLHVAEAARKRAPDVTAVHSYLVLLADLSTVVLNDVSIGESESFKLAAALTLAQRKAFDLLGVNPAGMFPEAGRQDSANRVPAKENLRFRAVKCSLNCRQSLSLM